MSVAVVIPFRSTEPHRLAALRWVCLQYNALGWNVYVKSDGKDEGEPWCKPIAVHRGIQLLDGVNGPNAEVIVVADGDVWADRVAEAVQWVLDGRSEWSVPGYLCKRLTQESTQRVLDGEPFSHRLMQQRRHRFVVGGGITIVRRSAYDIAPMDPRFVGWGGEDIAWGWALRTLVGEPKRFSGWEWHLWHPPQPDEGQASWETNELAMEYRNALGSPMMQDLIDTAKELLCEPGREPSST